MRTALVRGAACLALLIAACGGGGNDGETEAGRQARLAAALGARLLTFGEPAGTVVDSRAGGVVPGLQLALNPDAAASIAGAAGDGGERLAAIAGAAGMEPEAFRAAWDADRADAFARFAAGLEAADDADALRDALFIDRLAALPVHPDGVLLGSVRIDRTDGERAFFLVYDAPVPPVRAEAVVLAQLDRSPWQLAGGRSDANVAFLQFRSTRTAEVEGWAWVLPLSAGSVGAPSSAPAADGGEADGGETAADGGEADEAGADGDGAVAASTVVYLIEASPAVAPEEEPFALPADGRPLPDGFPASFLLEGGGTVTNLVWNDDADGSAWELTLLARASSFDAAGEWRDRIGAEGWEITGDEAVGFATVLEFSSGDGRVRGRAEFDAFEEDDAYARIVLRLQAARNAPN